MKTHATNQTNVLGRYARFLGVPLKVAMTAALLSVVFMAGCKDDTIVGICDTTAPFVISTDPVDNATGVAFTKISANNTTGVARSKIIVKNTTGKSLNKTVANTTADVVLSQIITVTFSETMDASTITTASFTLMQGSTYVAGTVSCSNATATFVPGGNLLPDTKYTGTITTSVKDLAGNSLASSYMWSFTTEAAAVIIPPTVSFTDPLNNATGVGFNKKIAATFSDTMNASTITTASFTLMQGSTFVAGTVSYVGTTAIYSPLSNLAPNTTYTATITTSIKDLAGIAMASNYVWSFTTGAAAVIIPPTVTFTDPANNATGVGFNKKIAATFSETMDASTITTATFTLMQGSTFVAGTVSYVGTTAIYSPSSNLAPGTTYTATITTSAKDLAGIALVSNYVWSFTTGAAAVIIPPTVTLTDPVNAATGVGFNKKIAATFSETMDASTITTATFTLMQGSTFVSGTVSYIGTTAIYSPSSNLAPGTTYTATITTRAKDLAGIALVSNYVWSFTTGAAAVIIPPTVTLTDPLNNAIGVGFNKKVAATFSETMDASTITTATFTLMQGSTFVSGTVSYIGTTAIYSPSSNLAPSTTYTATITTSAKDLAGIALVSNYVWSFTTGAAAVIIPPTVTLTDPLNNAIGVGFNKKIAATFSETMDASTITTATFTLMQGSTFVSGTVSYIGTTAIYSPSSNLAPSTTYTATITTSAKDLAGIALVSNYVWSFTTGAAAVIIPPTVTLTDPLNNAIGVGFNKKIAATFSETMDASTITTATFTLMQGSTFVAGTVSYIGTTAIYSPSSNLAPSTTYTATITTSAKDLAGIALVSNYVWSFTTGAAAVIIPPTVTLTDPLDNAIGVGFNKKIAATFSETMDASTITTATFTLMQGSTFVAGTVSYSGTTAIYSPSSNLAASTTYTATITTSAKDLAGIALVSNYVWSFTTGAAAVIIPPTVTLTDPVNIATGVALNKRITATFSETMDALTITTASFTLMQGSSFVAGTVSYVGTTATYAPSTDLLQNTTYIATITTGAKNLAGIALASNYVWSFRTRPTYTVALSSIPATGGTTSGVGTFDSSASVTVTATTNAGYRFTNWTEGVTIVSTNANYTFTITGNRILVANFIRVYTVTLSADPAAGGTASGGGTFDSSASVTVTATVNAGYTFANWTEGGNPVSTNANYTFTISADRTLVATFTAVPPPPPSVDLGLAATYGLAAYSAITNVPTSSSIINGDASIQINPVTSMTGFTFSTPAGAGVVTGSVHAGDAVATQVYNALLAAYNFTKAKTPDAGLFVVGTVDLGTVDIPVLPGHLPGHLPPGVYSSGTTMNINTNVVLDAGGDPNALWIFQIGSSLTTTTGSVTLEHSAQQKNVFFVPTASASIGTNTTFYGNILAGASITLAGNNTIFGRLLGGALGAGQIDMNGLASTITVP